MKSILVLNWSLSACKPIRKKTKSSAKLGGGDLQRLRDQDEKQKQRDSWRRLFLTRFRSHRRKPCSWFYANLVESLTEGKLDDREWILRFLNHQYFNNIIALQKILQQHDHIAKIFRQHHPSVKILRQHHIIIVHLKKNPLHCFWPTQSFMFLSFAPEKYLRWYQK